MIAFTDILLLTVREQTIDILSLDWKLEDLDGVQHTSAVVSITLCIITLIPYRKIFQVKMRYVKARNKID